VAPAGLHGAAMRIARHVAADRARTAEPDVLVSVLGIVPVPVRRAQVPGLVVEGAPACRRSPRGAPAGGCFPALTSVHHPLAARHRGVAGRVLGHRSRWRCRAPIWRPMPLARSSACSVRRWS